MKKIKIITLGCSKNIVDSEKIMAQLHASGYEILPEASTRKPNIVIVNTCGFIGDAKEESINTILELAEAKTQGLIDNLYVIGCLSQLYKEQLAKEIPEVDSYFGVRDLSQIVKELGGTWNNEFEHSRVQSTPRHYAYLKISEGCSRACGYCSIPIIRGRHISVPMEKIVLEARELAKKGVKELLVIAQDTTYYGIDIYGERKIAELLRMLCKVEGIEWIRLHYAYPADFPDELIDVMASEPKICKYLDIPFQHISNRQLSDMRREIDKEQTYKLIDKLRARIPDIALRTTLLTGYPNETDDDFNELKEFVQYVGFERLGIFPYSEEEGTYSARNLTDNVAQETKEQRAAEIMQLQQEISLKKNQSKVGQSIKVIIDSEDEEYLIARSEYDSPEVDQEILIKKSDIPSSIRDRVGIGKFLNVNIIYAEHFDLYAVPVIE